MIGTGVPSFQANEINRLEGSSWTPMGAIFRSAFTAKVDELMVLCDRLEVSLATAVDTRRRLLDALLADALAPSTEYKFEAAE